MLLLNQGTYKYNETSIVLLFSCIYQNGSHQWPSLPAHSAFSWEAHELRPTLTLAHSPPRQGCRLAAQVPLLPLSLASRTCLCKLHGTEEHAVLKDTPLCNAMIVYHKRSQSSQRRMSQDMTMLIIDPPDTTPNTNIKPNLIRFFS